MRRSGERVGEDEERARSIWRLQLGVESASSQREIDKRAEKRGNNDFEIL